MDRVPDTFGKPNDQFFTTDLYLSSLTGLSYRYSEIVTPPATLQSGEMNNAGTPGGIQSSDTQLVMNRQGRRPRQQQSKQGSKTNQKVPDSFGTGKNENPGNEPVIR